MGRNLYFAPNSFLFPLNMCIFSSLSLRSQNCRYMVRRKIRMSMFIFTFPQFIPFPFEKMEQFRASWNVYNRGSISSCNFVKLEFSLAGFVLWAFCLENLFLQNYPCYFNWKSTVLYCFPTLVWILENETIFVFTIGNRQDDHFNLLSFLLFVWSSVFNSSLLFFTGLGKNVFPKPIIFCLLTGK